MVSCFVTGLRLEVLFVNAFSKIIECTRSCSCFDKWISLNYWIRMFMFLFFCLIFLFSNPFYYYYFSFSSDQVQRQHFRQVHSARVSPSPHCVLPLCFVSCISSPVHTRGKDVAHPCILFIPLSPHRCIIMTQIPTGPLYKTPETGERWNASRTLH